MVNYARVDEITNEIRKIRTEQECVEDYLKDVWKQEDENYEELQSMLRRFDDDYEDCQSDPHLMSLMNEREVYLQEMLRECEEFLIQVEGEQKSIKHKCESDIDELEWERQRLSVL